MYSNNFEEQIKKSKELKALTDTEEKLLRGNFNLSSDLLVKMKKDDLILKSTQLTIKKSVENMIAKLNVTEPTQLLYNTLMSLVRNNEDISSISISLEDKKGNRYEIRADQIVLVLLWGYSMYCEIIFQMLKQIIDFKKMNENLKNPINVACKDYERLSIGDMKSIIKNYSHTKLFSDIDVQLRNAISHYSFEFIKGGVKYGNKNRNLGKLMILNKKINLLFTAILFSIKHFLKEEIKGIR